MLNRWHERIDGAKPADDEKPVDDAKPQLLVERELRYSSAFNLLYVSTVRLWLSSFSFTAARSTLPKLDCKYRVVAFPRPCEGG
jgi:hypothetical protein